MSLINQKFEISATGAPEALAIPTHYLYKFFDTNNFINYSGYWNKSELDAGMEVNGITDLTESMNETSPYSYYLEVSPVVLDEHDEIIDQGQTFKHEVYAVYSEEKTKPNLEYISSDSIIRVHQPNNTGGFIAVRYNIDNTGIQEIVLSDEPTDYYDIDVSSLEPTAHIITVSIGYKKTRDDNITQVVYNQEAILQFSTVGDSE